MKSSGKSTAPCSSTSRHIDSRNWMFLKNSGLDDLRNSVPSTPTDDVFVKGPKGLSPVLSASQSSRRGTSSRSQTHSAGINNKLCFTRVSPLQKQRLDNVQMIERALQKHPLALYPHLEDCVPPELFEDIVSVLDPEMFASTVTNHRHQVIEENLTDATNSDNTQQPVCDQLPSNDDDETTDLQMTTPNVAATSPEHAFEFGKVRNPYRWLPDADESGSHEKKSAVTEPRRTFLKSEEDEEVKSVTQQFCEWVASLGGDSNNVDESTITSLFASGYETKPALSVPIHVVELANIPPELRLSAAVTSAQSTKCHHQSKLSPHQSCHSDGSNDVTKCPSSRYRYGAWYLQPNLWKKLCTNEQLTDPNEPEDKKLSEAKTKSLQLDNDLAVMHGVQLFKDFVETKETRQPEFLQHIEQIHAAAAIQQQ